MNPTEIAFRTEQFFEYFRTRSETARRADLPLPDRLVLIGASLDALAKHWADTCGDSPGSALERMRSFLVQHGGHPALARVSAPMLRSATGFQASTFRFDYKPNEMNEVRTWRDDPISDELSATVPPKDLVRWSYPGILYVDVRCAWVHEFVPTNPNVHVSDADYIGRSEPYYRFISNTGVIQLMLPFPFLLQTFQNTLTSFERQAVAHGTLPYRE